MDVLDHPLLFSIGLFHLFLKQRAVSLPRLARSFIKKSHRLQLQAVFFFNAALRML